MAGQLPVVDPLGPHPREGGPLPVARMGLRELEILRLILRGDSVVDWRRLAFETRADVDHFLRLHLVNYDDPADRALTYRILKEAVDYLRSAFRYRIADAVAEPFEIHDLFLFASGHHPVHAERFRKIACIVVKSMHVIHHLEGRELLFRTPIAESAVARLVDERVMACAEQMRRFDFPIIEFQGSVKTPHSIITKLLAKRETVAAQIFDKVRYRIVTRERSDVPVVLEYLTRTLFPFNLVVPGQTENSLVSFRQLVEETPALVHLVPELHRPLVDEVRVARGGNPFSGSSYRVLNFVVDMPLRIDGYLSDQDRRAGRPRTVFSWVEFQIVDRETALENEKGDNSHERYKLRQRQKVLRRLSRGLVVPRARKGLAKDGGNGDSGPPGGRKPT